MYQFKLQNAEQISVRKWNCFRYWGFDGLD